MSLEVKNDEKANKFYADVDGREAVIEYEKTGGVYNLLHTFVPEELRGHGVAEQLVGGALEEIKRQGAKFLPSCPYIQSYLKNHPEHREGMAEG